MVGLKDGKNHLQGQQPLLAIDHIEPARTRMKNDRAQHIRGLSLAGLCIPQVIEQLQSGGGLPTVGALVLRNAQVLL